MRQGAVVEEFTAKGKRGEKFRVVFRHPRKSDVRGALRLVNCIRDEAAFLGRIRHETMKTEWLFIEDQLRNMRRRKGVFLFVEADGEMIGDAIISPLPLDTEAHVGHFGIMLKERFTGIGIGTRLMRRMLLLAKHDTRFSIIDSAYFAGNRRSMLLHKKLGFREYGRLPNGERLKSGEYGGRVFVYKAIKKLG